MQGLQLIALLFLSSSRLHITDAQCYNYGNNGGPYAYACANSNGNQPSGGLSLNNVANINWDPSTGAFTSNSNTDNSATGDAATIFDNTNANAYAPANPQPTYYAQVYGNANSNGQALTGNMNNLDQTNALGQSSGALSQQSSSSINGTGTGVTLSSNANANGNAYPTTTSTSTTSTYPYNSPSPSPYPSPTYPPGSVTAVPAMGKSGQHKKLLHSNVIEYPSSNTARSAKSLKTLRKKQLTQPAPAPVAKKAVHIVPLYRRAV